MAKIVKVTVAINADTIMTTGGLKPITRCVRPPECNAKKIQAVAHEFINDPAAFAARGDGKSYIIGVVADEDLAAFIASPDIIEIDQSTAEAAGMVLRPYEDIVTDAVKVVAIAAKIAGSIELTQDELDAMDSTHPAEGIRRCDSFNELLAGAILRIG